MWRLWWRTQLRGLRRPRWLWRVRLLKEPGEDVVLARTQLRVGRLLGRVYLLAVKAAERGRIERARVSDRIEPAKATGILLRAQRGLLLGLLALIVIGGFADWLVRTVGPDIASWLNIEGWLRDTFDLPSPDTLRNLLAGAAAGTATILGLVLSISLIAWQTTAERYRSTSIVSFLLRERAGNAVVRLLALGFAFSLWVLAMLEVLGHPPYLSAALALLISTAAVVSLISYRQAGLLGYLPSRIALSLQVEMTQEMVRAGRAHAGRSVEDYSRRVVGADLQIFDDLLGYLTTGDSEDMAECLTQLGRAFANYTRLKASLRPDGEFFEKRPKRLDSVMGDIEDNLFRQGLMNPMGHEPDHLWLERRVLALVRPVAEGDMIDHSEVGEALMSAWTEPLQWAWYCEDYEAARLIRDEIERAAQNDRFRARPELADRLAQVAWIAVEMACQPQRVSAERVVEMKPWEGETRFADLPWQAKDDARRLAAMVKREIAVVDTKISPNRALAAEVREWRERRHEDQRREMVDWAVRFAVGQLEQAVDERGAGAPAIALMTLRVLVRILHYGSSLPSASDLGTLMLACRDLATEDEREDLRLDSGRAALAFAEAQEWAACYDALHASAGYGILARIDEQDPHRSIVLLFDSLLTVGLVYGWAEYWQTPEHLPRLAVYVQPPYVSSVDQLEQMVGDRPLTTLMLPMIVYVRWAQPLVYAVNQLPDRVHRAGALSFGVGKEHPSRLIRKAGRLLFGAEECLEDLVRETRSLRDDRRLDLLLALHELLSDRRGLGR